MGDELMQTMQEMDATPRLIVEVLTSTLSGRRFAFTATDLRHGVLLGRASDCHVRFDAGKDLKVSGHHAIIDERDGKVQVRDQGSSNGVFLNDVRVTTSGAVIMPGSKLSLGQEGAIMKLLLPGQPSTGVIPPKAPPAAAAPTAEPVPQKPALKPPPQGGLQAPKPAVATAASAAAVAPPSAAAPVAPQSPPMQVAQAAPATAEPPPVRGMPSVQTDPALRERMMQEPSPSARTQPEASELVPKKKGGAMGTLVGAILMLLIAAGLIAAWHLKFLDQFIKLP
jgi:hypothetical protein